MGHSQRAAIYRLYRKGRTRTRFFLGVTVFSIALYTLLTESDSSGQPICFFQRNLLSQNESDVGHEVDKSPSQFPKDLFTLEQRRKGAIIFHLIGLVYMFVALAVVCDEFFVPSLDAITEKLAISEDVAGATFMAAGGSAPELFTSFIGVFISYDDVGIGTIVGSAVFNILFVISMCSLFSKTALSLTWWPLFRDVSFYSLALIILMACFLDSYIMWWEAATLFSCYILYVIFMKYNEQMERAVTKLIIKTKLIRVSSKDRLMPTVGRRRKSGPFMYAGSKFRQGLLQLMIHSLDPLHEGKIDEKTNQIHAIHSLKVLLDATARLKQNVVHVSHPCCEACSTCPSCTTCSANSTQEALGANRPQLTPTEIEIFKSPANKPELRTPDEVIDGKPEQIHSKPETPVSNTAEESFPEATEEPLDISWPKGCRKRVTYLLLAPIIWSLWITLPDVRNPSKRKWFPITFFGSIVWIAIFSYLMVWWANLLGDTITIPSEVMGLTLLAAGTSIPDLITSILVARKGFGDMAVSSSIGSNIFDVTIGLPIPWLISTLVFGPVKVSTAGMVCSVLLLFIMLMAVIVSIAAFKWKMNNRLAVAMLALYFVFIAVTLLLEYNILECPKVLGGRISPHIKI